MSHNSSAPFTAPCAASLPLLIESCVTYRLRDDHLRHSLDSVDFEPSKKEEERQGGTEHRMSGMADRKDAEEPVEKDEEVSYLVKCLSSFLGLI
jgi:hypothetical protein